MSYHSDTLAFKKSEILDVIQSICPNFHIDCEVLEDKNLIIEKDNTSSYTPSTYSDYKNLFYKQDVFNGFEVACLISGYNPNTLTIFKIRKSKWQEENPKFVHALDFVISASKTGVIFYHDNSEPNHEYSFLISNTDLKEYLKAKDIIIDGFNDDLEIDNANTPKNIDIESQTKIDALQVELAQARERIKLLEEKQAQLEQSNLLALICDDTAQERYAPDLVTAIKLWEHLYINNPRSTDSHSNKADTWLKNHTGYDVAKKVGSASKIREITAPFVNWSTHRDKKYKK